MPLFFGHAALRDDATLDITHHNTTLACHYRGLEGSCSDRNTTQNWLRNTIASSEGGNALAAAIAARRASATAQKNMEVVGGADLVGAALVGAAVGAHIAVIFAGPVYCTVGGLTMLT